MDGSQTLELLNVPIAAKTQYPVDVEFTLYDGVAIPNYRFDFHLRQFGHDDDGMRMPDVYGSMSFRINTQNSDVIGRKAMGGEDENNIATHPINKPFSIHPNPVKDHLIVSYLNNEEQTVTLDIYDMAGRKLTTKQDVYFKNSYVDMDVSSLVSGIYFISISNSKGVIERFKFVKE